jgi:hypothetical protein
MNSSFLNGWCRTGLAASAALLLHACAPSQDAPTPVVGLNVSRYLAVGDSYTAGVSNGGLTRASQEYSFPNQLAQQLRGAQPDALFAQPWLEGSGAGYLELVDLSAQGVLRTRRIPGQDVRRTVTNPTACGGPDTVRLLTRSATASALPQNLGIPGLLLTQIETVGLGNEARATPGAAFNPYFERLLPAASNLTYRRAVTKAAASATFFTFFLGLDNLMPYVRSGGECGPVPSSILTGQLQRNAKNLLDTLTAGKRPGIIAALPDVKNLPLLRAGRGDLLEKRLQERFGDKALLYVQDRISGDALAITTADYVLATALPRVGQPTPVVVGGSTVLVPYGRDARAPLRNADVLDSEEVSRVNKTLGDYNNELNRLAGDVYKMPVLNNTQLKYLLDVNTVMPSLVNVREAISVGGVVYNDEPVRGNFFSLDYYTLTPRGNALLANAFISAINRAYQANIPAIDANSLPSAAH